MNATDEYLPKPGEFDPLAGDDASGLDAPEANAAAPTTDASNAEQSNVDAPPAVDKAKKPREKLIEFFTPSELKKYVPPSNQCLVGDYHLQRGAPSVLAGPPGCGKSRAALWLGILGAHGTEKWFGMQVQCKFRTLILQNENGLARLHRDISELPELEGLDDWLKISAPPAYGLALQNPLFRNELKSVMRDFAPHLLIVDPWNACVRDAMEKDFQEGFTRLREVLAESPNEPACLILHHLRKPKNDDRHRGRNLAHLLSGSYVLVSVARSVLVTQPASDDTEDARIVMTCAKNNDGDLGARSAWERKSNLFVPVQDFDWDAYDNGSGVKREPKVKEEHIRKLFNAGARWLAPKQASDELQAIAEVKRSAAYEALKLEGGRFSDLLIKSPAGLLGLKPVGQETDADDADVES